MNEYLNQVNAGAFYLLTAGILAFILITCNVFFQADLIIH